MYTLLFIKTCKLQSYEMQYRNNEIYPIPPA